MMHMDMHTTVRVQCPIGRMPASNAHCISGICDVHMYVHYVCMQCTYYGYRTVTPPPSERTVSMQHMQHATVTCCCYTYIYCYSYRYR